MEAINEEITKKYEQTISELWNLIDKAQSLLSDKEQKEIIKEIKRKVDFLKSDFLSKKGIISQLLSQISSLEIHQKKELGKKVNQFKQRIEDDLKTVLQKIEELDHQLSYKFDFDLSINYSFENPGALHILTIVKNEIENAFAELGFYIVDGIEIEDEYHNFEALNIPADHPARDMWDTFYIGDKILRTHTSNMQIRILKKFKPPIKIVSSGKCYRRDNLDATHSFQFHQLEGFAIDQGIKFTDLIRTLYKFVSKYFGEGIKVNFVPSYFPFTEPSAEMSVSCFKCMQQDKDCPVCKGTGWIEILGCGMINPIVLKNMEINPDKYTGFAFGMGIERIAMLKYKIPDIRMFYENYLEFNKKWGDKYEQY